MTDRESLPHNIPDDSVEPEPVPAPAAPAAPDVAEPGAASEPPAVAESDPVAPEAPGAAGTEPASGSGAGIAAQPTTRPSPVFAAPPPPTPEPAAPPPPEPVAPAPPAPESVTAASAEIKLLRLEIAHRDQLLLTARERRLGLEREIGRLERQLDVAIEEQREAATERAELRRLLGNVQMQVQSLLQLPPPAAEPEDPEDLPPPETPPDEPPPPRARRPGPRTAEAIVYAQAAGATADETEEPVEEAPPATRPAVPRTRRAPSRRRGLVDDARGVLSNLRRLW